MRTALVSVFSVLATSAVLAQAGQQRPSFSGSWATGVLDNPAVYTGKANRSDSQLQVGTAYTILTIRQDPKIVEIIEQNEVSDPNRLVYRLDGSEVTNPFRLILGKTEAAPNGSLRAVEERIPARYVTRWNGSELVSAITVDVRGEKEPRHYEETISLGANGILSVRIQRVGTGDSRTLNYKKM